MKPQLIDCGSKCKLCDGYGIMTLDYPSKMIAPCLSCSPTKNLYDLLAKRNESVKAFEKSKELELIDAHNSRMLELK